MVFSRASRERTGAGVSALGCSFPVASREKDAEGMSLFGGDRSRCEPRLSRGWSPGATVPRATATYVLGGVDTGRSRGSSRFIIDSDCGTRDAGRPRSGRVPWSSG